MTTPKAKYIRTEPPALLTEPLTVTLDGSKLDALNAYRQARHAWLACEGDTQEQRRLHHQVIEAGAELAGFVGVSVQHALGELDDWSHD
ncbi:hypothetical protein AB9U01_25155 [Pseudomonas qingdaonensis]|uniref:hypothetical protein n=1 Tax=Pseudomonas qingdaonensis TaxID=2056231 RepID=UPI00351918DE